MANPGILIDACILPCDKPRCCNSATHIISCPTCAKTYRRCANHDGAKGANRSLTSHNTMYHPKAGK
jgi:hypothetical protein